MAVKQESPISVSGQQREGVFVCVGQQELTKKGIFGDLIQVNNEFII